VYIQNGEDMSGDRHGISKSITSSTLTMSIYTAYFLQYTPHTKKRKIGSKIGMYSLLKRTATIHDLCIKRLVTLLIPI
jgi:hypothetical protein